MNSPATFVTNSVRRIRFLTGRVLEEMGLSIDRSGSRVMYDIAYKQKLSRHTQKFPLYDHKPDVRNAWVAPNALLLGRVLISPWATIWYGAVLRAEINTIRIGHFSSIGDGTVIYSTVSLPVGVPPSVNIGKNVAIGDNWSIFSSIIDDEAKIGTKTVISEGWVVERGAEVEPNSVVPPGRLIPAGQLWGGSPVRYIRDLTEDEKWKNYHESYSNCVENQHDQGSLWPQAYLKKAPKEAKDAETIDEYVERNYFKKGLFK